jgi:regulatory protein
VTTMEPDGVVPQLPDAPDGIVTAITAHPRKAGRFIVSVDDQVRALISGETVGELGLRIGTNLDGRGTAALAEASARQATFDRAVHLLSFRPRSSMELRRKLLGLPHPAESRHVEEALMRLTALGYVDDAAFAREFTRSRVGNAGMSRRRVAAELRRRGVAREAIADALEEGGEAGGGAADEVATASDVARRRLRAMRGVDDAARRRRLYAFLARRGFDADTIRRALAAVLSDAAGDEG